jgi:light-regulated signal transduction histidine kinase (bacteriophytochrome)/CheY-like chemotaxis protein
MTVPDTDVAATVLDLSVCAQEPIHRLGQVQNWGFLLTATLEGTVRHASTNVMAHLGVTAEATIGRPLDTLLLRRALHTIRGRLHRLDDADQTDRLFGMELIDGQPPYDVSVHFLPDDKTVFVLEAEISQPDLDLDPIATVKAMMARLLRAPDLPTLHDQAALQLRRVLGFDRVMVYRFDTDGSGEVVGESVAPDTDSFRGLRYPASDIPVQARALYCHNWLRLIANVAEPTQSIVPAPPPGGDPLDLSSSILRSVSTIHATYLRNMGVVASLSISLMRGGQLWGLLACHHGKPMLPSFQRRSIGELFGQLYSLQVESRERADAAGFDVEARAMNDRALALLSREGATGFTLQQIVAEIRTLVPCDGVAIHSAGQIELLGFTPNRTALEDILDVLDQTPSSRVFATVEIARTYPPAAAYADVAAGMLVIPISPASRDYLIFFRREAIHTVTWAGDPDKPVEPGALQISPRRSFEAWRQTRRGQSAAWTDAELRVVEALRITLLEVMVRRLSTGAAERQRAATRQQELLIGELNHRVRNILALIRALVACSQEPAGSLETFVARLDGRIQALSRSHDQLTTDRWGPVLLSEMIESEFHAFLSGPQLERAHLSGPPVLIDAQALTVLALAMHELATNAVKFGALSGQAGTVDVRWHVAADGDLAIIWQESGGPPTLPPDRQGFGTTVIENTVPHELQGKAALRYEPTGLVADFTVPSRFVHLGVEPETIPQPGESRLGRLPAPRPRFTGLALVVEDSIVTGMNAEEILSAVGFTTVEVVGDAVTALERVARIGHRLAFALLDVNLGDHTSMPVAEELMRRGIPFGFATGDASQLLLTSAMAEIAPVILKPYHQKDIADLVSQALAMRVEQPVASAP